MNAWINLFVMMLSTLLFLLFYIRSVSPATLETVMGEKAYAYCGWQRVIAIAFEVIVVINYFVYASLPVQIPLPHTFPWARWISYVIAAVITVPSMGLMVKGMIDAGSEAIRPAKENPMYGGIYEQLRHPQALGEVLVWLVLAFALHSPFLAIFSLFHFPIFAMMCFAEEQDLLVRFGDKYVDYMQRVGWFGRKK